MCSTAFLNYCFTDLLFMIISNNLRILYLVKKTFHITFTFSLFIITFEVNYGTIHETRTLKGGGRGSRQKHTSIVFMTSFYCLKAYKEGGGGGVWKSPNLGVRALWLVPTIFLFSWFRLTFPPGVIIIVNLFKIF